jgi:serine phosphatase RsbU (regulator of sigma subunit)
MADSRDRQTLPDLVGYESCLCRLACMDSSGDVFVSLPLPRDGDLKDAPPSRCLVALGDVSGRGEITANLRDALEAAFIRLAGTTTDPASILKSLNSTLISLALDCYFATLLVVVIDSNPHELTLANAGHVLPFIRRADRQVESLVEGVTGIPLWIVPDQTYNKVNVPIGPGEVVVFHTDGVTSVFDPQDHLFDHHALRLAIAQAPVGAAPVGSRSLKPFAISGRGESRWTTSRCSAWGGRCRR